MSRFYIFIGKHLPEIIAFLITAVVLIVGSYLALCFNAVWLNRSGSLVIIIGVMLAASRYHEWLHKEAMDYVETNFEKIIQTYTPSLAIKNDAENLTNDESSFRVDLLKGVGEEIKARYEPDKRRLKIWEVYLVIGGTFLNGFGDYIVSLLKSH